VEEFERGPEHVTIQHLTLEELPVMEILRRLSLALKTPVQSVIKTKQRILLLTVFLILNLIVKYNSL
jgi:hypothetical protein